MIVGVLSGFVPESRFLGGEDAMNELQSRRWEYGLLGILILVSAIIRFGGITYSAPFHFHIDEQLLLTTTADLATDPMKALEHKYFFTYGSLPRTILLPLFKLAEWTDNLNLNSIRQQMAYYAIARSVSAFFGVISILLIWIIGERQFGRGVGWGAAILLAFSPLHVRDSHFFTPDVMLTFFLMATMSTAALFLKTKRPLHMILVGGLAGLAVATKANALPGLLPLAICVLAARRWKLFFLAVISFLLMFCIGYWPIAIGFDQLMKVIRQLSLWVAGVEIRQPDLHFVGTKPWIYWYTNLLYFGAGPVLLILGSIGLIPMIRRSISSNPERMLLSYAIPLFVVLGATFEKFMRYSLPLHPFLALCGGLVIASIFRAGSSLRILRIPVSILVIVHSLYGFSYASIFWHQDPRIRAGTELAEIVPPGTTILLETTHSNPPLIADDWNKGIYGSYLPKLGECMVSRKGRFELVYIDPFRYLYDSTISDTDKWTCLDSALARSEIIVLGPRYREQYLRLPRQFPTMNMFYQGLDSGELGFQLVNIYENNPRILGFSIDDRHSELTFRLFDRPEIRVYAKYDSHSWNLLQNTGSS